MMERPALARLFAVWLALGLQSFGGGAALFVLIRRAAVERERWVSDDDFSRAWALCQLTPGINLFALTLLIGRRVRGAAGATVALAGLLVPSVAITIAVTAAYAHVKDAELVRAAVRGVIPATVGLGVVASVHMARSPLETSRREGPASFAASVMVLVASGVVALAWRAPIAIVLVACGVTLALVHMLRKKNAR